MDYSCPTVKVKAENSQGFVIINKEDFDSSKHEKYSQRGRPRKEQLPAVGDNNAIHNNQNTRF